MVARVQESGRTGEGSNKPDSKKRKNKMKKLMIAAVTAAVAGGAFATTLVYDYKASVTHMYDKLVNVRNTTVNPNTTVRVYQKFKKTATLQGYLIVDDDAFTSQRLNASGATVYDQGRNRAFLVVRNSSAEANVRAPKIMPAVIEAKRLDTKFSNTAAGGARIQNGIAEGILFVGGDLMAYGNRQGVASATSILPTDTITAGVRPKLEARGLFNDVATVMPAFYADYAWTSCYLFGEYNGPQWSGLWRNAQGAIDAKQRIRTNNAFGLGSPFYHDTWLNHAGIGTYTQLDGVDGEICCGLSLGDVAGAFVLDSLSGNFKGGIFLCSDDGFEQAAGSYNSFLGVWWEDQFWAPGIGLADVYALWNNAAVNLGWLSVDARGTSTGDYDQPDVWTDGDIELNTTDVAYGSWSIKRTTRLNPSNFTDAEIFALRAGIRAQGETAAKGYVVNNINQLNGFIKGAYIALQGNTARFVGGANNVPVEIHAMTTANRFTIPFLTPKFAQAYGLVNVYVANP